MNQNRPKPDSFDILLKVGGFALVGFAVLIVASSLMAPLDLATRSALAVFAAGAVANLFLTRKFESGRLTDFGLGLQRDAAGHFARGLGMGAGAVTVLIVGAVVSGRARCEDADANWSAAWLVVVLLAGVLGEEMLFRGYAFQYLVRRWNEPLTILVSGVVFGSAHLLNDRVQFLGMANTVVWGCLLGYAYARTRTLWLACGLHFGWNLALALSTSNMSGLTIKATAWNLRWSADDLWSGGGYGLEGGLLATIAAVPVFLLVRRVR